MKKVIIARGHECKDEQHHSRDDSLSARGRMIMSIVHVAEWSSRGRYWERGRERERSVEWNSFCEVL